MKFDFIKNLLNVKTVNHNESEDRIRITLDNLEQWPNFQKKFDSGKIKADSTGRLRYLHGAPVGDLVLTRINKDGKKNYKESASEWFDPESLKAQNFIWP